MDQTTTNSRYDAVARALHWCSAALVVIVFAIGLAIDVPPKPWYPLWLNTHVLIGLTIFALALARLGWRAGHPAPPPVQGTSPRMASVVRLGHAALYAAMLVVPLIGLAPLFTRGRGIDLGLFAIASPMAADRPLAHTTTEIHMYAAYALIALASGHVIAALWHHFVKNDDVLLRMTPPRNP